MIDWWIWFVCLPLGIVACGLGIGLALQGGYDHFICVLALAIVGSSALMFGVIAGPANWISRRSCAQEGSEYGTMSQYRELSRTCYLRLADGTFVPDDQFTTLRFGQVGGVK
jgi:hypothetical protein